ncbi:MULTISPECIES: CGNR zinc finger domain-containing protein [unclassified Nocardia]|uniref:CGNR zinc finger domain-containing protein n=1 Tax=unclassified Nocardia TaxID=2637762 RepID=UPI00343017FA
MSEALLIGEPLALDLVNTRPTGVDLLATPDDLANWLALQAERFPELAVAHPTSADLAAVHAARDHISAVLDALLHDRHPPVDALRGLNATQSAAPAIRQLEWDGDAVIATMRRNGTTAEKLAAVVAEAAADLLADPSIGKLKRCEADDCVLLFLPAHPRRRWCSAERCGNRVRVARYYQRHKSAD